MIEVVLTVFVVCITVLIKLPGLWVEVHYIIICYAEILSSYG